MFCGKWRKISKSRRDLDLELDNAQCQTFPSYFHILQYLQVSSLSTFSEMAMFKNCGQHLHYIKGISTIYIYNYTTILVVII